MPEVLTVTPGGRLGAYLQDITNPTPLRYPATGDIRQSLAGWSPFSAPLKGTSFAITTIYDGERTPYAVGRDGKEIREVEIKFAYNDGANTADATLYDLFRQLAEKIGAGALTGGFSAWLNANPMPVTDTEFMVNIVMTLYDGGGAGVDQTITRALQVLEVTDLAEEDGVLTFSAKCNLVNNPTWA